MKLSIILKAIEKEVEIHFEVISITKLQNNQNDIIIVPQYLVSLRHKINNSSISFVLFVPTSDDINKITKEIKQELKSIIH
jgi:hypothetical protein